MSKRKVAITGIGLVTPLGNDTQSTWEGVVAGRSGVGPTQSFDASGFSTTISSEVKGYDAADFGASKKSLKFASRGAGFALGAAAQALEDAGVRPEASNAERWGLCVGAGMNSVTYDDLSRIHEHCTDDRGDLVPDGFLSPDFPGNPVDFSRVQCNAGLGILAKEYGIKGYSTSVHTACASGGQAIGTALKVMRRGTCDYILAGGFDSMINPMGISGFCLLGALSTDNDNPTGASRPFDATRNGFVLGEGAGFLVLEDFEKAEARGAHIYAELAGDGNSLSCYRITDSPPDGDGPIQAIHQALADAGVQPSDIDYVNAHGTSTKMNDESECAALTAVMGSHIDTVRVSSTKSSMGHLIAAAGAVEAVVCALGIEHGTAPVSANYKNVDPLCQVNVVKDQSVQMPINAALSNSLGFGGSNSSLVLKSPNFA